MLAHTCRANLLLEKEYYKLSKNPLWVSTITVSLKMMGDFVVPCLQSSEEREGKMGSEVFYKQIIFIV